jgi:hypothetical protein
MPSKVVRIVFAVLIPMVACVALAAPKERENIELQVVSSKTKTHGSDLASIFTYTDVIFAVVNGKKMEYECAQHGDLCPVMESGKTYPAVQDGNLIYITMSSPGDKKSLSVKYQEVGSWQ